MAKIHYDELTVGVPSKASSVNYENADGTKESVQSKISKIENDVGKSKQDIEGSQGRNLIPYPYDDGISKVSNGITFTVNDDGSVTANGTATANAYFFPSIRGNLKFYLKSGTYGLSGCPNGGSSSTYRLSVQGTSASGSIETFFIDYGSGVIGNIPDGASNRAKQVAIQINSGQTVSNLTFYPMLEEGTIAHAYEPTTESNVTLKQNIADQQTEIDGLNSLIVVEEHELTTNQAGQGECPRKNGYIPFVMIADSWSLSAFPFYYKQTDAYYFHTLSNASTANKTFKALVIYLRNNGFEVVN